MPRGSRNSCRTRVRQVFDAMAHVPFNDWPLGVLLDAEMYRKGLPSHLNYGFEFGVWGNGELGLWPPPGLLRWLVQNVQGRPSDSVNPLRQKLFARDPETIVLALGKIDATTGRPGRAWYILEGLTYPDVFIETPDTLIVIEGKCTGGRPTTNTTWIRGRHQIWRNIDAAWEVRGNKVVFGMFIVEGDKNDEVPPDWLEALADARSPKVLASSLPHRSPLERAEIFECLRGITTWQRLCRRFKLDFKSLSDTRDGAKTT